ncbi:hypothetical protein BVI061214_02287 [Thermus aquaticus]|uniref:DUF4352 domain-containing protein n=1 Tax=Thermus aquaticus TaxID=271 RepID=A0A0N0U8X7_THEAQ|nr:hypothetical protein [Thermus aquaticus]KOX91083.1 hypothetical protein BVI061214_02287 [Thermus aquaticus]
MKRTLAFLWVLAALGVAQQVNLPKPSGPVIEVASANVSATFKIQGCARDQEGKVVCAVQIQSAARTNQQVTVPHQGVRAISARGFSYPGYLTVEGGQVDVTKSTFALPAGGRASGKLVFPNVPQEETFFAALYFGGMEFRGIPIGQALPPQAQAPAPQAQPAAPADTAEPWKRFVVGPFTFELQSITTECCSWVVVFNYKVTSSIDSNLQIRFDKTRTILEDGQQRTGGVWGVSGGRSDFIAGIPLLVSLKFYSPGDARGMTILYAEFEVFDGKDWQRIVWRNIPIPK